MGNFRSDLRKVERSIEKLTGSRRQATAFGKKVEKCVEKRVSSWLQETSLRQLGGPGAKQLAHLNASRTRFRQLAARRAGGGGPQLASVDAEIQIRDALVRSGRANWVNLPGKSVAILVERGTGCVLKYASGNFVLKPRMMLPSKPDIDKNIFLN